MTNRGGFTLIEVMVALVVTGLVTSLAYAAVAAGFDTSDRIERYRTTVEAQAIVRELLIDALRHPTEQGGAAMNDVLFVLDDATRADGLPVDRIQFFSRGVTPPLGASDQWSVTLGPVDDGVRLVATSLARDEAVIDVLLPSVRGLEVRVLERTADSLWLERWDVTGRVPAAVALTFFGGPEDASGPAMVVHSALETVR
jgi:prepilin-type N-terminal cleavage/methylation domain-containing protein